MSEQDLFCAYGCPVISDAVVREPLIPLPLQQPVRLGYKTTSPVFAPK